MILTTSLGVSLRIGIDSDIVHLAANTKVTIMPTDEYITVHIKPEIKAGAQAILEEMGISTSEAIDLFLTDIALEKTFPSDLHIPNETTLETFQDSESGKNMKTFATLDELYQDLGI